MPLISTTLPSDGTTIDAADVNTPFNDILNVVNGNIDSDNVATGGLNYENFGTITGEIPASDMQDSGNVEKFRDEANVAFVASGCVWSALSGLNGAMTAGVVYNANGVRNAPGAVASKTFTASRDTYVDIATNGAVSYSEVTNGAAAPAITTDYVRLVKVVTDGSAITSILQLGANTQVPHSNPYKFAVYRNAAFNLTNGSFGKVTFDTEDFDTNGNFAAGTYTVPVNGFYQFSWRASHSNSGDYRVVTVLVKNGANAYRGTDVTSPFAGSTGSALLQCAAGDTIEVFNLTTTAALAADVSGKDCTWFNGHLVSRT